MDTQVNIYPEDGRHRIVWRDPGTGKRRSARRTDPAEAQAVADHVRAQLERGRPGQDNRGRRFQELIDWYLEGLERAGRAGSYVNRQRSLCKTWLSRLGDLKCGELQPHHFRNLLAEAREAGRADETLKSLVATITGVVSCGQEAGYIHPAVNPADRLSKHLSSVKRAGQSSKYVDPKRIPPIAEVRRLAHYMGDRWEWWRELQVLLAAFSGLREGELLALRGLDVDMDQSTVDVTRSWSIAEQRFRPPKGNKVRTTFVAADVRPLLEQRLAEVGPGGLLFPKVGQPDGAGDEGVDNRMTFFQTRFAPARQQMGWPKNPDVEGRWLWNWHSLRHVFCTWCLASPPRGLGLDATDVAYFAGHHSPAFTMERYVARHEGAAERAAAASATFATQ